MVDDGAISVVQKNGQLDMVFDPMMENLRLYRTSQRKVVNDSAGQNESLNEQIETGKPN